MEDFHCDMFELSFQFAPEEINRDAFLKALGFGDNEVSEDEDGNIFVVRTFGHREETSDYHAQLRVVLKKEKKSRVELRYHASKLDIKDEKPPYVEDCAQWIAEFFKSETVKARISAAFVFDKSYAPTITLPFPLAASEKALTGSLVTGISIQPQKQEPLELAIIQRSGDETFVSTFATSKVNLQSFDLSAELKRFSGFVGSLVKKLESSEEEGDAS